MKYLAAVALLAACTDAPDGLDLVGTPVHDDQVVSREDAPTAVGGTQEYFLLRPDNRVALPPYVAEADGRNFEVADQDGTKVTVHALDDGVSPLTIRGTDGQVMDEISLRAKHVDHVAVAPRTYEQYPYSDAPLYGPRARIAVNLFDVHGTPLVDTSMELSLPGSDRLGWDELYVPVTAGATALSVTAGDHPAIDLPIEVATTADSIALLGTAPSIPAQGEATVCFEATHGGRPVFGLQWEFAVDNRTADSPLLAPDCVAVATDKTSGTVTVVATVAGAFTMVSLPVMAR